MRKMRSAPAAFAAAAIAAPRSPPVVETETWASGSRSRSAVRKSPDPCPVRRHEVGRQELHVDVDAVQALLLGEVHELLDPAALRLVAAVELPVLRLAETRVDHLDAGSTLVGLANQLLAEIPGDPPVAGLVVLHPAAAAVGHREQRQRRQVGLGQVLGDAGVHLPVRDEPVHLVPRDGRRCLCLVLGGRGRRSLRAPSLRARRQR